MQSKSTPKLPCQIAGCGKKSWSRGLCHSHLHRFYRYGDPTWRPIWPCEGPCMVTGCEKPQHANGYCTLHDARVRKNGNPDKLPVWNKGKPMSAEQQARLMAANKVRIRSAEENARNSASKKGKRKSPEAVAKRSGPNHWHWKGGASRPLGRREWRELRAQVIQRDGYRCRWCGRDDRTLIAHHLVEWRDGGPDSPENLIAVCRHCHASFHNTRARSPV